MMWPRWLRRPSKPAVRIGARRALDHMRAEYDAAATGRHNQNHWANADGNSPNAAASPTVRAELRKRSRYELLESNSFGLGIVRTLATDLVASTGPRLTVAGPDPIANQAIETQWQKWAKAIKLPAKLTTMRQAKIVDGEAVALRVNNPRLFPVQLDIRLLECDHLANPNGQFENTRLVDGIELDEIGEPLRYHLLDDHPGSDNVFNFTAAGNWHAAGDVIHWYREDRPGQRRGIPEMVAALSLFAQLRRYTLATVAAAEVASDFAAIVYTDSPAFDPADMDDFESVPIEARTMTTLPYGWKISQLKPEQPSTQYPAFVRQLMTEIVRGVSMPLNKALGDSSGSSFSSGRLDHHIYHSAIDAERQSAEADIFNRLLVWWFDEASLVPGHLPAISAQYLDHARWVWPAHPQIDESKSAAAAATLHDRGLISDEGYWISRGQDPAAQYEALSRQREHRQAEAEQTEESEI